MCQHAAACALVDALDNWPWRLDDSLAQLLRWGLDSSNPLVSQSGCTVPCCGGCQRLLLPPPLPCAPHWCCQCPPATVCCLVVSATTGGRV